MLAADRLDTDAADRADDAAAIPGGTKGGAIDRGGPDLTLVENGHRAAALAVTSGRIIAVGKLNEPNGIPQENAMHQVLGRLPRPERAMEMIEGCTGLLMMLPPKSSLPGEASLVDATRQRLRKPASFVVIIGHPVVHFDQRHACNAPAMRHNDLSSAATTP
jgi:hypothetical protein